MKTILLLLFLLFAQPAWALTLYYVDVDYSGGGSDGSAAAPWLRCDQSAQWNVINAALAGDDVTVYFSARIAGADTDQTTTFRIAILRSDMSAHRLTLDGGSQWNSNDAVPAWAAYAGNSRWHITHAYPITTTNSEIWKKSYVTVSKFKATSVGGQIVYYWGGDHVVIEEIQGTGGPGQSGGPGIFFNYARANGDDEFPCVPDNGHNCGCVDITIQNNIIHDNWGEGIYIGGVNEYCPGTALPCPINAPAHDQVLVEGNILYDTGMAPGGTPGGEADGLDIKNANTNVIVRGNTIYRTVPGSGHDGITTNSGGLFEGNFLYNYGRNGITLGIVWNTYPTRNGSTVRNNILVNNGGGAYTWAAALRAAYKATGDNWHNLSVYNNTLVSSQETSGTTHGEGFLIESGITGTVVRNNIFLLNEGYALLSEDAGAIVTHTNNLFYDSPATVEISIGGTTYQGLAAITGWEATALVADPILLAPTATPYVDTNFVISPGIGAPPVDAGFTVGVGITDYFGTARPQGAAWDIGADESLGGAPVPPVLRTRYVNPDAAAGGNGTTPALVGANCAYQSLQIAETAEDGDISATTGTNEIVEFILGSAGTADTTAATFVGWTTEAANYIYIHSETASKAVMPWDITRYRLEVANADVLKINEDYVRVDGVQIRKSASSADNQTLIYIAAQNPANEIRISNCVLRQAGNAAWREPAIRINDADAIVATWNNSIFGLGANANGNNSGIWVNASTSVAIYSSTIIGGFHAVLQTAGVATVKNTYGHFVAAGGTVFSGTFTMSHSASSDATAVGTAPQINVAYSAAAGAYFANVTPGSEDFHTVYQSVLFRNAVITSAEAEPLNFTRDIEDVTRGVNWEIGAYESSTEPPMGWTDGNAPTFVLF